MLVGRTIVGDEEDVPGMMLEGGFIVDDRGVWFGLLRTGLALGPSSKSPQSSSSSQVVCEGAGWTKCCFLFGGDFTGGGFEGVSSANSPQSPNESSSHAGSGGSLLDCRWLLFNGPRGRCSEAGAGASIESEPSRSIAPGMLWFG